MKTLPVLLYALSLTILSPTPSLPLEKPKVHTVEIKAMKFIPAVIKVRKGDTVIWVNRDLVAHDATEKNNAWTTGIIGTGKSGKTVISKSADYYCSIHKVMKGKIVVE